ncbi:hypothetical protein NHQ30_002963 [Ciborinia camelliae]|nr:hypothetical protein NHQ30_002963 [Ciborinia camelliae]
MANTDNQNLLSYQIYLEDHSPIIIDTRPGTMMIRPSQTLPQQHGSIFVNLGVISRKSLFTWVHQTISDLQSFDLLKHNIPSEFWNSVFRVVQNHACIKDWIFARPRLVASGFYNSLPDYRAKGFYTAANVLDHARAIWKEIEKDLKDEEPDSFMKELFQQVFDIWLLKCFMNRVFKVARNEPRITQQEIFAELTQYTHSAPNIPGNSNPQPNLASNIPPNMNPRELNLASNFPGFVNPQLEALANFATGNHQFTLASGSGSNVRTATANNHGGGGQSTGIFRNANNLTMSANQRDAQHDGTNMSGVHNKRVGHQSNSSRNPNASQPVGNQVQLNQAELPGGAGSQYGQQGLIGRQIEGVGTTQLRRLAQKVNHGGPGNSSAGVGVTQKRSTFAGSGIDTVPDNPSKKFKVETDPAPADSFSSATKSDGPSTEMMHSGVPAETRDGKKVKNEKKIASSAEGEE